jgi:hypothetical protein
MQVIRRLFTPDDKIAPGLYMKYWEAIVKKHGADKLDTNKLKPYREMRDGAILAALWTKVTGEKHFVSLPHDEPADVEIYHLAAVDFKEKPSYRLEKVPVQLTRCSLSSGETIVGQVRKKNKPALANATLVVHMIGEDNIELNLQEIIAEVHSIEELHPREIVLLAPLEDASTKSQAYGQLLIYSRGDDQPRSSRVDLDDPTAFFTEPPIMHSKRGTGQAISQEGEFSLMLP